MGIEIYTCDRVHVCVLVAQLCLTLCNAMDNRPPGSSVHGILQARILEWVAISSSRGSSWPRNRTCISVSCIGRWILYHLPPGKLYFTSYFSLIPIPNLFTSNHISCSFSLLHIFQFSFLCKKCRKFLQYPFEFNSLFKEKSSFILWVFSGPYQPRFDLALLFNISTWVIKRHLKLNKLNSTVNINKFHSESVFIISNCL